MNLREAIVDSLGLSKTNAALLVRGFFAKMGFLADFLYISLISPGGNYLEMSGVEGAAPWFAC